MGFLLRRINGSREAANTPRIIVIRYLGYLETLEKNSPIVLALQYPLIAIVIYFDLKTLCWNSINFSILLFA